MKTLIVSAVLIALMVYAFERHLLPSLGNKYPLGDRLSTYFAFSAVILGVVNSLLN